MRRFKRGKPDCPTQLASMEHAPADGIRPTQQMPRPREITGAQRSAHRRTRDALLSFDDGGHLLECERAACRMALQQFDVAGPARTETEVIADEQPPRATSLHNEVDESLGRQRRKRPVEVLHDDAVDALGRERLELVAQPGDARRRAVGGEEFARMRLERHHGRGDSACTRRRDDARQQRLMAAMHAVEVADRQRAGNALARPRNSAEHLHVRGTCFRRRQPESIRSALVCFVFSDT